jgi:hypothetical protein
MLANRLQNTRPAAVDHMLLIIKVSSLLVVIQEKMSGRFLQF